MLIGSKRKKKCRFIFYWKSNFYFIKCLLPSSPERAFFFFFFFFFLQLRVEVSGLRADVEQQLGPRPQLVAMPDPESPE